jgi:hypothetical protein
MRKSHNKISAFILLLLSTLPLVVIIIFAVKQQCVQLVMESSLEEEQLTSVTILTKDFHWFTEGEEIKVNGHFFDVESFKEIEPGILRVYGLYDWQEEQLYDELTNFIEEEENKANTKRITLIKWFTTLYDYKNTSINFLVSNSLKNRYFLFNTFLIKKGSLKIELPPPRCGLVKTA